MNFPDAMWEVWGLFCGIVLFISIGYEIPMLYHLCLGGGSIWMIFEVLFHNKLFAQHEKGEVKG